MNGHLQNEDCVVTTRADIVENRHYVNVAVVDSHGKLLYSAGNPNRVTLLRSAAKPAQALAIIETGALEIYQFDDADLALICGSHNSEERHVKRARSMLRKINAAESDLRCGGHPSLNTSVNRSWIKADYEPTAINNNCSGKHSGMLGGAQALGAGFEGYHMLEHPMQQGVKRVVEDLSSSEPHDVRWGVDGCNLPAPAMTIHRMAKMFAVLAESPNTDTPEASKRTQNLARIFHAMTSHPELVAGEGRFCTELMEAFEGDLVGKVGAEGCYGVAIRASESTRHLDLDGSIGIAVKIEDGNREILYAVVSEILTQLQIGNSDMRKRIESFHYPKQLNTMGIEIGHIHHAFRLKSVDSNGQNT